MGMCFLSLCNRGYHEAKDVRLDRLFAMDVRFKWGYAGCF
jgi:hypothetical protein